VTTAKLASPSVTSVKVAASAFDPISRLNLGLAASVSANALTIALKQADGSTDATSTLPVRLVFRSATATSGAVSVIDVTGSLSVVVPSGTTLGSVSAAEETLNIYAINNAGTVELAVGLGVVVDEGEVVSTTAISGGATRGVLYSTTARSNVACRLLGKVVSTQATAGTWATSPSALTCAPCSIVRQSYAWFDTLTALGSTNTNVTRYTNINKSAGTDLTITQSSTLGDSITVNKDGKYSVFASLRGVGATTLIAITKNSTTTTASGQICSGFGPNGDHGCTSATVFLKKNDVIRVITANAIGNLNTANSETKFGVERVD
jgi:hypothetical protein